MSGPSGWWGGPVLRYDALLCWWWRDTWLARYRDPPYVVFVCQDDQQRDTFIDVASRELSGHLWHAAHGREYVGRDQIIFVTEAGLHGGDASATRVATSPDPDEARAGVRRSLLPVAERISPTLGVAA